MKHFNRPLMNMIKEANAQIEQNYPEESLCPPLLAFLRLILSTLPAGNSQCSLKT